MSFAVFCESAPFVRTVLCRTVAKTLNRVCRAQMAPVTSWEDLP